MIAAAPLSTRDRSRLLVYHRGTGKIEHREFRALPDYLSPSDLLVLNNSRVLPARLSAQKPSGGKIALLFLKPISENRWEVLVKGKADPPIDLRVEGGGRFRLTRELAAGRKEIAFDLPGDCGDLYAFLERWGEIPLPPYILKRRGGRTDPADRARYQTVYAEARGSAAAPTAGLHFTERLIGAIRDKGVRVGKVTLHIGLDTFQPIRVARIEDHKIHREWFQVPAEVVDAAGRARREGGKIVAVGTTATRALESAAREEGRLAAAEGETALFIRPGYRFKAVDALITNFHLPRSTPLALVSAFAGGEAIRTVYREAIRERYRFYSYGDAMLIL